MLGRYSSFKNISFYSFACINKSLFKRYSRVSNGAENLHNSKVNPRKIVKDTGNLVWRDPNFELLTSNEFPLFLPGNIGVAWYDPQTTVQSSNELIMEQIDDIDDCSHTRIICRVQDCPTVLRNTVCDLFPYLTIEENSKLSVITLTLKPNIEQIRSNTDLEIDKMAQTFLIAAKNICDKLKSCDYWADFINPFSGRPYFSPASPNKLYSTDEKFRCLDFEIFEMKRCKIICNKPNSQKKFVGSLFTNVPCKKKHLNSVFM